jgi:outer membrane protein OmpA-like peptidoglycan-associated protein
MKKSFSGVLMIGATSLLISLTALNGQAEERNVRSTYGKAISSTGNCVKSIAGAENLCVQVHDSDGDGVPDDRDKCPNTPKGSKVDINGCIAEVNVPDVLFDFNKATLKPGFAEMMTGLYEEYRGQVRPDRIVVTGHTDNVGSDKYNQKLSLKRAQSVKQHMVKVGGIKAAIIETIGAGESMPIADNSTEEGRSKNRRVVIKVYRATDMVK